MTRRYLLLSLLAFLTYSVVAPLLKIAMETIPSTVAVFLSNAVMLVLIGAVLLQMDVSPWSALRHEKMPWIIVWGVLLAVSLLAYYRALELGPVSVVVPIYGLFIALSSIIGIGFLGETLTKRKVASIGFAILAIILMSI